MSTEISAGPAGHTDIRPFDATLHDGRRVRLRPVTPADRERLLDGFRRMSRRSRLWRFRRSLRRLTEKEIRFLTEPDYHRHVAWGAVSLDEPGEPGVGVARFVRDVEAPEVAECAITVVDGWQGVGLGQLLAETLLSAALVRGVDRLVGTFTPDNLPARKLAARIGGRSPRLHAGLFEVEIPVSWTGRTRRASLTGVSRIVGVPRLGR